MKLSKRLGKVEESAAALQPRLDASLAEEEKQATRRERRGATVGARA